MKNYRHGGQIRVPGVREGAGGGASGSCYRKGAVGTLVMDLFSVLAVVVAA